MAEEDDSADSDARDNSSNTPAPKRNRSKRVPLIVVLVAVILGLVYGIYWAVDGRWHITTDDAYVHGDTVDLSTQVPGTVVAVKVALTQHVKRGEILVRLDPTDAQVALARAEATLGMTVRQTAQLYQEVDADKAVVRQRHAQLELAAANLARARKLVPQHGVSRQKLQQTKTARDNARAALDAARHQLKAARAAVDGTDVAHHPAVLQAEAAVRKAWVMLARTKIVAPVSGYVAQKNVQVGEQVSPARPLLAIVPLATVYVEANFKENQLARLRIGQPVAMESDTYGGAVSYHGKIVGFSAGTGAAMSVLPPQNASGNWIKIVQRLPVRIQFQADELNQHPLMLGMSMHVDVDVRRKGSDVMLSQARVFDAATQTKVYAAQTRGADAAIKTIVAKNLPPGRAAKPAAAPAQ